MYGVCLVVREGTDEALLAFIASAPRALVFLSVPWSCSERIARIQFLRATRRLADIGVPLEAFLVNEDTDLAQGWLRTLGLPEPFGHGVPLGAGSVLWLESGKVVKFVGRGIDEMAVGIIGITKKLWGASGKQ